MDCTEKLETKIEEVLKFMEEQQRNISRTLNPEVRHARLHHQAAGLLQSV
jgi:hypothetical protein